MQNHYILFQTDIYVKTCDLDLQKLYHKCQKHHDHEPNSNYSNRGGAYQGHHFYDNEFTDMIMQCFPRNPEVKLPPLELQTWININGFGAWNALHNHLDTRAILSGVFYVQAPPNTGNIFFYDPRFLSSVGAHYQYYYPSDGGYMEIEPEPNMLLFFPPSLFHMVGPNLTQHQRCSIAFNIMVAPQ